MSELSVVVDPVVVDPCNEIKNAVEIEVNALSKLKTAIDTDNEDNAFQEYTTAKSNFENTYDKCEEYKKNKPAMGGKRKRTAKKRHSKKQQQKQQQKRKTRRQKKQRTHWK